MDAGKRVCIFTVLLACIFVWPLAAQRTIGSIDSVEGYVQLDAFGNQRYVDVLDGDLLYEQSIIKTDYESWAYISIDGEQYTVAPNSETPVRSFVTTRRRGIAGFFSRLIRGITDSLAPPEEEEEIPLGGRAAHIEDSGTSWVFDIDPDELFAEAETAVEEADYRAAVDALRLIDFPEDGSFEIEEYYVTLAHALMGLGDFHAAMSGAFEYALVDPEPENVSLLTPRLQLLAGISAYYAGEDEVARETLDAYLEAVLLANAAPEAVVTLVRLMRESGQISEAALLIDQARAERPGEEWDMLLQD